MFVNLKVTIFLSSSVAIQANKGAFDSVLAMLYFNDLKNKGLFNGDYEQKLPFLEMSECGVYHTSFAIFNNIKNFDKEVLIKKFDHTMYAKYGVVVDEKGREIGRKNDVTASLKNAFFSHEKVNMDSMVYYARGDKEVVTSLLKKLRFVGKKSSLGWGSVSRIEVDEIENDFSILKGNRLMRNLAVKNSFGVKGNKVGLFRLTHPYWSKSGLVESILP